MRHKAGGVRYVQWENVAERDGDGVGERERADSVLGSSMDTTREAEVGK